jgi:hypothetical protein
VGAVTDASPDNQALSVRELQADDAPAMRALFAEIFKKEMSQALWDWKYARSQSVALGVWREGKLIAHYGGMGTDILMKGFPSTAVQICDVMVETSARQAVRRHSPFFLSTSGFIERYIGYDRPWLLGYGFPSDRHMALAAHLKLYGAVGRMWELTWELAEQALMPWMLKAVVIDKETFARHSAALDSLAAQQRTDLRDRIVVRKDASFVRWRYLQHPQERYELLLVKQRFTGKPVGLCVLKVEAERALWMEALGPVAHLPALAQVARAATWLLQRRKLVLWCSAPDVTRFGNVAKVEALAITTPSNIWTPGPAPEELQDRWWLLAGDTDWL